MYGQCKSCPPHNWNEDARRSNGTKIWAITFPKRWSVIIDSFLVHWSGVVVGGATSITSAISYWCTVRGCFTQAIQGCFSPFTNILYIISQHGPLTPPHLHNWIPCCKGNIVIKGCLSKTKSSSIASLPHQHRTIKPMHPAPPPPNPMPSRDIKPLNRCHHPLGSLIKSNHFSKSSSNAAIVGQILFQTENWSLNIVFMELDLHC